MYDALIPLTEVGDRIKDSRAVLLLRQLITGHSIAHDTIAGALGLSRAEVDAHVSGREPMSLEAQSRLATFVIDKVPTLRRAGHRLRAQTSAASDFHAGRTETHLGSRPGS